MKDRPNRSWFAELRSDGGLFALLGALVLLINIIQPLTAANAGEGGHWVICTIYGADKPIEASDLPSAMPENCPICVSGNLCSSAAPAYKAVLAAQPAFAPPAFLALARVRVEAPPLPLSRHAHPPSGIRAPPLSA